MTLKIGFSAFISIVVASGVSHASEFDGVNFPNISKSISPMVVFKNESGEVDGETVINRSRSTLYRSADGITFSVDARELPPGAYSAWVIIYENPQACTPPECGEDDYLDLTQETVALNRAQIDATQANGFWFSGGFAGNDGRARFYGAVNVGQIPGQNIDPDAPNYILFMPSSDDQFDNPEGATIMFQLRYHGPAVWDMPEQLGLQVATLRGYCEDFKEDQLAFNDLAVGCYEPQASWHSVVSDF